MHSKTVGYNDRSHFRFIDVYDRLWTSSKEDKKEAKNDENNAPAEAQAPNDIGEQLSFDVDDDDMSHIPYGSKGGIWYNTKERHLGTIAREGYKWDDYDVLMIQLSDQKYYGYEIEPLAIELVKNHVAKVTLRLEDMDVDEEDAKPARVFIYIYDKGKLKGKKFLIVDEDEKRLNTN